MTGLISAQQQTLRRWSVRPVGQGVGRLQPQRFKFTSFPSLAFSPDGRILAAGGFGNLVRLFEKDVTGPLFATSRLYGARNEIVLQGQGFDVWLAGNGQEALEVYRQRLAIAVVLLDVCMPKLDGPQTPHPAATALPRCTCLRSRS